MLRKLFTPITALSLVVGLSVPALADSTIADLSLWTVYDQPEWGATTPLPGIWNLNASATTVVQQVNGLPTFFISPNLADGQRFRATFVAPAAGDDDFFGLALGFSTDPTANYLLIDWKGGDQPIDWMDATGPVTGVAGLAVSRVTGVATLNELWGHDDSPGNLLGGVTELARGATLGATGWAFDTSYDFVVEYTTESLDVWVNGSHEISIAGKFTSGPVAFYDFSQPGVTFSAVSFEPLNDAPEVLNGGADDVNVNEGQVGATSGAFIDPDGDPVTLSCAGDCVGFVDNGAGTWSWSRLLPEGPYGSSVTVTATDGLLQASDTFDITVHNLAPVITATSGLPSMHDIGGALDASADYTDDGLEDTHTALFSWGDGTTSPGAISESPGSGTTTASHAYQEPGDYTVTVTVWDDDGASDTAVLGEVFVFDPDTFVTGGGWVSSPQGAWEANRSHTGKGTFGFIVRYDKSGYARGSLEFQLHKGINLHAKSFDYLFINDGIAHFAGTGTVNGESGYHFEVIATDERYANSDKDLFWIEITGPGGAVYNDGVYPAEGLPIAGRGIQVHDKR